MAETAEVFVLPPKFTVNDVVEIRVSMVEFLKLPGLQAACDASKVETIDTAGLQLLLAFYKSARTKGKICKIVQADLELKEIIVYSGTEKVFTVEGQKYELGDGC